MPRNTAKCCGGDAPVMHSVAVATGNVDGPSDTFAMSDSQCQLGATLSLMHR
jgi:hypothetical protein